MYAIVEIAGQQFKIEKDQKIIANRIHSDEGEKITFDNVMLIDNSGAITIGAPAIEGAFVEAKVLRHFKGKKVIVFKKKRRKGYKKKNGHRQYLSELEITGINTTGGSKKSAKKDSPKKIEKTVAEKETKVEAKPEKKASKKTSSKGDDLKKVEGIGPKIAQTLTDAGVDTFAKLSELSSEKISELISEVRGKHVADTWPKQAKLASEGKWEELEKWQDELDGGKVK